MNILRNVSFDAASEMKLQSFKQLAPVIFRRDDNTCQLCGFQSRHFLKILPFENDQVRFDISDYKKPSQNRFRTVCTLCYESNRLDYALNKGLGRIIYFPEMTQKSLNYLFHTHINIVFEDTKSHPAEIRKSINHLKNSIRIESNMIASRENALEDLYGASDSKTLIAYLTNMTDKDYKTHSRKILRQLRYWPDLEAYEKRAKKWKSEAYQVIDIKRWEALVADKTADLYNAWAESVSENPSDITFPRFVNE